MDFSYSDEQQAIANLAKEIFTDKASHERLKQIERGDGPHFDLELWADVAKAGLLGIAIPQELGGAGLGFLEIALIIEQVGRATAPIPILETLVLGALPIAEFGSVEQRKHWLPRVAEGKAVLTAALVEGRGAAPPSSATIRAHGVGAPLGTTARAHGIDAPLGTTARAHGIDAPPGTAARALGGGWKLSGTKICVAAGEIADCVLVPATTGDGAVGVFLVDPSAPGVRVEPLVTTSGQPEARITLDDVRVGAGDVLGDAADGARIVGWITERATAALSALALGVCEQALALTAEYIKTRKQFDVPIATFQAVGQRAADAYIDTEAIRLTAWQAAWRIAAGLPAAAHVAVAKFWAAEAGQRVVHTAQHLHGGIGVDRDYPLHRYFLYAKQLELTLGGATAQLLEIGRMLADQSA
jgi:alkylation response protein AidB-like acyl-CoA dehydrogenase